MGWDLLPPVSRQVAVGVLAGMLARMVTGGESGDAVGAGELVRGEDSAVAS
jgi:hypothetical protein